MMRKLRVVGVLAAVVVTRGFFLPGCAGSDGSDGGDEAQGRFDSPGDDAGLVQTPASEQADACADAWPPCQYTDPDADTAGSDLDASAAPSQDGGATCDYPATCSGATSMGSVCADQGSDSKTYSGDSSRWLALTASECDHGVRSSSLKITAVLDVPDGTNFDLYMYMDTDHNQLTCSTLVRKSTGIGSATENVAISWGDQGSFGFANDSDDSRPIRFEVRHVTGACSKSANWKLTVYGNR